LLDRGVGGDIGPQPLRDREVGRVVDRAADAQSGRDLVLRAVEIELRVLEVLERDERTNIGVDRRHPGPPFF